MANLRNFPLLVACVVACTVEAATSTETELCGPGWVDATEAKLAITDSAGHGPDLGSAEWAEALTRRLGGHHQPGTTDWCAGSPSNWQSNTAGQLLIANMCRPIVLKR